MLPIFVLNDLKKNYWTLLVLNITIKSKLNLYLIYIKYNYLIYIDIIVFFKGGQTWIRA